MGCGAYKQQPFPLILNIQHLQNLKVRLQGASSDQVRRIRIAKLQKQQSTICGLGVRTIQSSSPNSATLEIKLSHPRIIQVLRRLNKKIIVFNSEIAPIHTTLIQNSICYSISCLIYFRLEICVHKFLACPMGHIYLSSLSSDYQRQIPSKTKWPLRTVSLNL